MAFSAESLTRDITEERAQLRGAPLLDGVEPATWYEVNPETLYPAAIEDLRAALAAGKRPQPLVRMEGGEVVDVTLNPLAMYYDQAAALPEEAWDLELGELPRTAKDRELRAQALECARLWFTEKLHQEHGGGPMGLHITRDERWKL